MFVYLSVCVLVCLSVGAAAAAALLFQFFIIIFCRSCRDVGGMAAAASAAPLPLLLLLLGMLLMPQISVVINARLTRTRRQA